MSGHQKSSAKHSEDAKDEDRWGRRQRWMVVALRWGRSWMEKTQLIDDLRGGRNRWVSSESRTGPAERTLRNEGVDPSRSTLIQVKGGSEEAGGLSVEAREEEDF